MSFPLTSVLLVHAGVESQDADWLRFWLDHGADIHRAWGSYCNGPTALSRAVDGKAEDLVRILLEHGGPVDRIGSGLVGKKEVWVTVADDELQGVELIASDEESTATKKVSLTFEDGVSEEWLKGVQLRRSDAELAQDGSGRELKSRE